jgi:hypothetical protein
MLARETMRWTPRLRLFYCVAMVERQRKFEVAALLRAMLASASLAALAFIEILFVFSAVSVLSAFELYPHDSSALYLIELVLALLAASTVGVMYAHQHYQR